MSSESTVRGEKTRFAQKSDTVLDFNGPIRGSRNPWEPHLFIFFLHSSLFSARCTIFAGEHWRSPDCPSVTYPWRAQCVKPPEAKSEPNCRRNPDPKPDLHSRITAKFPHTSGIQWQPDWIPKCRHVLLPSCLNTVYSAKITAGAFSTLARQIMGVLSPPGRWRRRPRRRR